MAPNKLAELKEFHRKWNNLQPITDEAEKHRFTDAFSKSLAKTDPRWGRKSRKNNEGPISKDTLGYWRGTTIPTTPTDGQLDARDIIMSSGQTYWGGEGSPDYDNILARWYPTGVAVEQPPTNPPGEQPPPSQDDAALKAIAEELKKINQHLTTIDQRLTNIEAKLNQPLPQHPTPPNYEGSVELGRFFGSAPVKIHPVE